MPTEAISIAVDADTAQSFCKASPEERRKLELLLRLWLRELTSEPVRPLKDRTGSRMERVGFAWKRWKVFGR